jgi:hypothetical protein
MYAICRMLDGTFKGEFRLQDGTERKTCKTLEGVVKWLEDWARMEHRRDFSDESITWWQQVKVRETVTDIDGLMVTKEYERIERWDRSGSTKLKERSSTENGGGRSRMSGKLVKIDLDDKDCWLTGDKV